MVSSCEYTIELSKRNHISHDWSHFGTLLRNGKPVEVGKELYFCIECFAELEKSKISPANIISKVKHYKCSVSTGNLTDHLSFLHNITAKMNKKPALNQIKSYFSSSPKHAKESKIKAVDLALWYARDLLAFEKSHSEGFIDFLRKYRVIDSNERPPHPTAISRQTGAIFATMEQFVKSEIRRSCFRGTCAFDAWTSEHKRTGYLGYTFHYPDETFPSKNATLLTVAFDGRHTAERIEKSTQKLEEDFQLGPK